MIGKKLSSFPLESGYSIAASIPNTVPSTILKRFCMRATVWKEEANRKPAAPIESSKWAVQSKPSMPPINAIERAFDTRSAVRI
jgi:hypothetical protein